MKSLPTQARAVRKRHALICAAIKEFSDAGFEHATAKSIAAEAGVATGTFYQHFENKNDILRVIAGERFAELHEKVPSLNLKVVRNHSDEEIVSRFESTLRFVYGFHAHDPELHQVLEQRRGLDPKLRDLMRDGEAVLKKRVLQFVQAMNVADASVVASNLFSMAEGIVHRQVFDENDNDPELVIKIGAKMLASYFAECK